MNHYEKNIKKARELFELEKYSEASKAYLDVIKGDPNQQQKAIVWAELCWLFYKQKEYHSCIEAAQNTLELDPEYESLDDLYRLSGYSHSALSQMDKAAEFLEKSLQIESSSEKQQMAIFELLKIYFQQQNYQKCDQWIGQVEDYLFQNQKEYWLTVLFFKGFVKYYLSAVEESEQIFEELLENSTDDPRRATAMFGLAFINFHRKNYLNTINLCESVTKHDSTFFDMESVGFLTAASFKNLGRNDVFETYYLELKKKYPQGRYTTELDKLHQEGNGKD